MFGQHVAKICFCTEHEHELIFWKFQNTYFESQNFLPYSTHLDIYVRNIR
jgi:hypothetical protein